MSKTHILTVDESSRYQGFDKDDIVIFIRTLKTETTHNFLHGVWYVQTILRIGQRDRESGGVYTKTFGFKFRMEDVRSWVYVPKAFYEMVSRYLLGDFESLEKHFGLKTGCDLPFFSEGVLSKEELG